MYVSKCTVCMFGSVRCVCLKRYLYILMTSWKSRQQERGLIKFTNAKRGALEFVLVVHLKI